MAFAKSFWVKPFWFQSALFLLENINTGSYYHGVQASQDTLNFSHDTFACSINKKFNPTANFDKHQNR
jgi:hypothetical protein